MPSRAALAALVAALLAFGAAPALAAPPPTLTGQSFFDATWPYGSASIECLSGNRYRFSAASTTTQPYAGRYTETGEVTMRVDTDAQVQVSAAQSEFTIESPDGQVVGTKRFVSHPRSPVRGTTNCEFPPYTGLDTSEPIAMSYTATITTPAGVFNDRGTATMDFEDEDRVLPTEFTERFTSALSATEQQHSVLFGKRTPGSSFSAMSVNTKRASPFVFYFPGTVRRIHAFIDGKGATSGSQAVRAVLYRRDPATGGPGAYITRSFEFTVQAGMSARWVPFWLAPPAQLQPGVYWLGLQTGGAHGVARYAWDSVPSARRYNIDTFADGASDPFGTSFSDDQQISIFAFGSY